MKVRSGFVSNSSSSSFLIYGCGVKTDIIKQIASKLNKDVDDLDDDYFFNDLHEDLYKLFKNNKHIRIYSCCDGEMMYIGKSWDQVGDNETGKQFKQTVQNEINSVLGVDVKCRTCSGD